MAADESVTKEAGPPREGGPPTAKLIQAPTPGGGQPTPGIPEQPAPGIPDEPGGAPGVEVTPGVAVVGAAGVPSAPQPGVPVEPKPAPPGTPQPNAGPQAVLSGSVVFPTYTKGVIRVTVFDGDHSNLAAKPPRVLGMTEIDKPGTFSVSVPAGSGKVYIEGSIDENDDGRPGPQEPQGRAARYPVTVGTTAVTDIGVTLQRAAPPPSGEKQDDF